ncbi:hypothetical protein ALO70_102391, partial [Pseudomonas amygdali pv. eriobotryae]
HLSFPCHLAHIHTQVPMTPGNVAQANMMTVTTRGNAELQHEINIHQPQNHAITQ